MNIAVAIQAFVTLLWIIVIGLVLVTVLRASRGQKVGASSTSIIVVAAAAIILTVVSAGLVFVQPEERGVVISAFAPKGYREEALQPGLRWVFPFVETVVKYPISRQTYTMSIVPSEGQVEGDDSITARTQDGQEVVLDASVIYQIDPAKVVQLHIDWQSRYQNDLVRAQSRGVIRDAVAQYKVEEVVSSKRLELSQQIRDTLAAKLSENGLLLLDYIMRNITFSPEYAASVEQKQIAEQQAQQAKLVVEQRKQEAEQARQVAQGQADAAVINAKGQADARLIQAEAEAKSLELIAAALKTSPDLLTYNYINRLAPNIQVMLVPSNTPFLLPLPSLSDQGGTTAPSTLMFPTPAPTPLPSPTPVP